MKSPFTGKEMRIQKEWRTMNFRKEDFQILFHSYKCEDTGEQFEDDLFSQLNYNQVVNQYREKYSIPFPEQIAAIRKKYDLSASKMSQILGFGPNSYSQYEKGEVPNQSNAKLIQLAENPCEFKKLVVLCRTLDPKFAEKLHKKIDSLIEEEIHSKLEKHLESYFLGSFLPNSLTGYRKPDLSRFAEMVVFFTEKLHPWKTKMNKLLFYADFTMYKQSGFSISGLKYRAITMGPVPNNFNGLFEYLANKEEIFINDANFSDGGTGEQFNPNPKRQFNPGLFTSEELGILKTIAERFQNATTNKIIDISHQEKAWLENKDERKLIDYKYSFDLN